MQLCISICLQEMLQSGALTARAIYATEIEADIANLRPRVSSAFKKLAADEGGKAFQSCRVSEAIPDDTLT